MVRPAPAGGRWAAWHTPRTPRHRPPSPSSSPPAAAGRSPAPRGWWSRRGARTPAARSRCWRRRARPGSWRRRTSTTTPTSCSTCSTAPSRSSSATRSTGPRPARSSSSPVARCTRPGSRATGPGACWSRWRRAPPHAHHYTDVLFYVLDGTFEILVGDTVHRAPPGAFVFVPRGTVRSPRVAGDRPGGVLVAMVPGGAERAFDEFAEVAARLGDAFDPGGPEARAVARRYGSDLV